MIFEIRVETDHSYYTVTADSCGQILRTDLSYFSGLQGRTIFDSAVNFPDSWIDCNTSVANLYFTTDDLLSRDFREGEVTVKDVTATWHLPYKKVIPTKNMIGDRKVITPDNILKFLQVSDAVAK